MTAEHGTAAMYAARLRECERARDELGAEVERLAREREDERARANEWLTQLHDAVRLRAGAEEVVRCEASLRARWEARTEKARAELRALVAALSLDDGPRAKAIQHARSVLEEWGMR